MQAQGSRIYRGRFIIFKTSLTYNLIFYLKNYKSITQLKKELKNYKEYYYNERIKLNLNRISLIEYRSHYYQN
ncbi:IS3 family transposase [Lacinutrix jangbogonensis]|uniref:IS3 family transposase n=1 Tax=Lacinutrix jangbogonensis TaxID=1469557 RepID=UPI0012E06DCE